MPKLIWGMPWVEDIHIITMMVRLIVLYSIIKGGLNICANGNNFCIAFFTYPVIIATNTILYTTHQQSNLI